MDNYFQTNWAGNEGHPAEDELLLYVDGELVAGEAEHVRGHLETCWSCRVKTEKMNEAISDFIDYRNVIITPMFESPPQGWRKLNAEMRRLLSPHAGESRQKYPIWRWLFSSGFGMRAAAALAFVLVILAGFVIGREMTLSRREKLWRRWAVWRLAAAAAALILLGAGWWMFFKQSTMRQASIEIVRSDRPAPGVTPPPVSPSPAPVKNPPNVTRRHRPFARPQPQAILISQWRSPTESLLRTPSEHLFKRVPRLDESLVNIKAPIPNQKN